MFHTGISQKEDRKVDRRNEGFQLWHISDVEKILPKGKKMSDISTLEQVIPETRIL